MKDIALGFLFAFTVILLLDSYSKGNELHEANRQLNRCDSIMKVGAKVMKQCDTEAQKWFDSTLFYKGKYYSLNNPTP